MKVEWKEHVNAMESMESENAEIFCGKMNVVVSARFEHELRLFI